MADGNQGGGGPAQAPAGDFLTKLSEAYPYGDEPPRLTVAINDMAAGAPDGTEFGDDGIRPRRHEVPKEAIFWPETIGDVLAWIDQRIRVFPMDQVWLTQAGPLMNWCADPKEEQWAQAVTEVLFGATYGGPGSCYDMGTKKGVARFPASENWETYIFSRIQRRYRSTLERRSARHKVMYGHYNIESWRNPRPIRDDLDNAPPPSDASSLFEGSVASNDNPLVVGPTRDGKLLDDPMGPRWKAQENDDPAVPIVAACQHLATYGALTRGFRVEHLNGVGYAAEFGTGGFAIFSGKPATPGDEVPPQGGRWYTLPTATGDGEPASAEQAANGSPPVVTYEDLLKVERARQLSPPLAPGTIFVFDPDAGARKVTLYLSAYEDQYIREKILMKHLAERKTPGVQEIESPYSQKDRVAPDYQRELELAKPKEDPKLLADLRYYEKRGMKAKAEETRADIQAKLNEELQAWENQKALARDIRTKEVVIDLRKQLDGSHIHYILRVHKDKPLVQLMDTGNGANFWSKIKKESRENPGRGALVEFMQAGIVDGNAQKQVGPGQMLGFCGMGVTPPPPEDLGEMAAFIKKARPIGLFRLVLTRRPSKGSMTDDDVLYVSRLARMYGSLPEQNYTIAQMLWGIRNTPGFTNVQPWVIFFIPRGILARSMWARGGREMTLDMFMSYVAPRFEEEFGKATGLTLYKHYLPAVAITNSGLQHQDYAGKAQFQCRWKYMSGSSGRAEPSAAWPPPIERKLKEIAWNSIHVHASFKEDARERIDALTPSMFRDGAASFDGDEDAKALS
ncbi:hypothetical protein WME75_01740 [Sorangium sp. So ce1014]|uniref:hypothetical protein n=1 Tax=Sorangium sp. So ce1014 TaxID=3133326 RepID=UPI003F5F14F5